VHEAAHAVVALALGVTFEYVSVEPTSTGSAGRIAIRGFPHPDLLVRAEGESLREWIEGKAPLLRAGAIVAAAGRAAERVVLGLALPEGHWVIFASDDRTIHRAATIMSSDPEIRRAWIRRVRALAATVVEHRRSEIEAVAFALEQNVRLEHADVERLCRGANDR